MASPRLTEGHIEEIVQHCSLSDNLRLPSRMSKTEATNQDKLDYLKALLQHDPGVFLERHGALITKKQRVFFEPLRDDYEVNYYIMVLEDSDRATGADDQQTASVTAKAKNRRLAKMARLDKQGFFEEEAARKRAPLLHHHYLGKFEALRGPVRASTLHDQIIQQHEETQIAESMARERREEERAGAAFEATISESESDESTRDEDCSEEMEIPVKPGHENVRDAVPQISREDMNQNREDFSSLMRARFLSGEDGGADADAESSLDDDWEKERAQDSEDKYFES